MVFNEFVDRPTFEVLLHTLELGRRFLRFAEIPSKVGNPHCHPRAVLMQFLQARKDDGRTNLLLSNGIGEIDLKQPSTDPVDDIASGSVDSHRRVEVFNLAHKLKKLRAQGRVSEVMIAPIVDIEEQ